LERWGAGSIASRISQKREVFGEVIDGFANPCRPVKADDDSEAGLDV
jgi:hypothetical protein